MIRSALPLALLFALAATAHAAPPAQPLALGRWEVSAVNGEPTGGGGRYHLTFDRYGKGTFTAGFGCNSMQGRYRVKSGALTLTMAGMTEMACGGAEGRFEKAGLAIIGRPMAIHRGRSQVHLTNKGGSIELRRSPR